MQEQPFAALTYQAEVGTAALKGRLGLKVAEKQVAIVVSIAVFAGEACFFDPG